MDDAERATVKIVLDIGDYQAKFVQFIEDAVFGYEDIVPANESIKCNPTLRGTAITMVCNIFKHRKEWCNDHQEEEAPKIGADDDGWLVDADDAVYCPEDFCIFGRATTNGFEQISHTDVRRDDCIQATIRFAPYSFSTLAQGRVAGVKIIMEEIVDIKRLPSVTTSTLFLQCIHSSQLLTRLYADLVETCGWCSGTDADQEEEVFFLTGAT